MKKIVFVIAACWLLSACAPQVGSEKWCKNLEKKSKGDWTANDAKEYARNCILRQ